MSHVESDFNLPASGSPEMVYAERRTPVTIKDVARLSGVSVGTVSNVLNNREALVRDDKRGRVLQAARALNFQPNAAARSLAQGRTKTVGVVFHTGTRTIVVDPYASTILQGILIGAANEGYGVLLYPEPWRDQEQGTQLFAHRRVDGILAIAPRAEAIPDMVALGLPMALVSVRYEHNDSRAQTAVTAAVDVDNVTGGRIATEHLLSLGHRKIAHLFGDHFQRSAHEREAGWRLALKAAGIEPPPEYCIVCDYQGDPAYEATQRLLALSDPPTAIFAANDKLAFECLRAARDSGVVVPQDLSVVGFDDIPSAALVTPSLTTVGQPLVHIGKTAVELLIARLNQGAAKHVESIAVSPTNFLVFSPELVVRDSTAACSIRSSSQRRPDSDSTLQGMQK